MMKKMKTDEMRKTNGGVSGYYQCNCGQKFVYTNWANRIVAAQSFNVHVSWCPWGPYGAL